MIGNHIAHNCCGEGIWEWERENYVGYESRAWDNSKMHFNGIARRSMANELFKAQLCNLFLKRAENWDCDSGGKFKLWENFELLR
jgi:hypothetical protein